MSDDKALVDLLMFCLTSDVRINGKPPVKIIKGSVPTDAWQWTDRLKAVEITNDEPKA